MPGRFVMCVTSRVAGEPGNGASFFVDSNLCWESSR